MWVISDSIKYELEGIYPSASDFTEKYKLFELSW